MRNRLKWLFFVVLIMMISCRSASQVQIVGGSDADQVTGNNKGLRVSPGTCVFYGELLTVEGNGVIIGVQSLDGCGPGVTRYPKVGTKISARFKGELGASVGQKVHVKVMEFEKSFSILEIIPL
ncbi:MULTISPECIES: hypothetical protein [Flammeovirga]|uniref:Lipoprotein n=1 Tax=Flammeovirga agarivorans TaxID=2726742 RepID=A0A7X8SJN0_9BACT|nr:MULTISPECIES: hypothetical protein [Flammeovirga]NLR91343.1 hypothetical protein [Flammeovirga agarivorans]